MIAASAPGVALFDASNGLTLAGDVEVIIGFVGAFRDHARRQMSERINALGLARFSVLSDRAMIFSRGSIGDGSYIGPLAVIECGAEVGVDGCVLSGAVVSHDCVLMRDVFVGPGAVICGGVTVGAHARIGAGAVILPGIHVGAGGIVGAGVTVRRNVTAGEVFTG